MNAISTRQKAGNSRGASEIYLAHMPGKGQRRSFRRQLQHYANLVIAPRIERHPSIGQLEAHRMYAAQCLIASWPSLWSDLPQMASAAPRGLPFRFTALDAWRIALDLSQRQGVAV